MKMRTFIPQILLTSIVLLYVYSNLSIQQHAAISTSQPAIALDASKNEAAQSGMVRAYQAREAIIANMDKSQPGIVAAYKAREAIITSLKRFMAANQYDPQAAIFKGQPTSHAAALGIDASALCSNPTPSCLRDMEWLKWSADMQRINGT